MSTEPEAVDRSVLRSVLRGKIHRARVTGADVNYVGSITLDPDLMEAAGIAQWEQVHVLDVTNGARLETYVIRGVRGTGEVCINGAAAHLVHLHDLVIILAYEWIRSEHVADHRPREVHVTADNRPEPPVTAARSGVAVRPGSLER